MPNYRQAASGKLSGTGNDLKGVLIYSISVGENWQEKEPDLGALWPAIGNEPPQDIYYNYPVVTEKRPGYYTVEFHFNKIKDLYVRSTIKTGTESVPISTRENYLTAWSYLLVCSISVDPTRPAFYDTKKDLSLSESESLDYQWIKKGGNFDSRDYKLVTDGDELLKEVQTIPKTSIVVHETQYFLNKVLADQFAKDYQGKLARPNDQHNNGNDLGTLGPENWLCDQADTAIDGAYITLIQRFKFKEYTNKNSEVKGWDTDLYNFVT